MNQTEIMRELPMAKTCVVVLLICAASDSQLRAAEVIDDGTDAIECANLIYSGTKSSVCFSEKFLAAVGRDTTVKTVRRFKSVKLASDEIYRFPFAIMTGEGDFSLTETERRNLRRYLDLGGFLLASAGCSNKAWDDSFRRELNAVFPEFELAVVSGDHPIFRTVYEIGELKTKGDPAQLEGLTILAKIVLIYSSDGLNDTTTMHGCCCCGSNEIRNSQEVNANVLVYSLLQ